MPQQSGNRWKVLLAIGIIALAALAAYHNTFSVPFLFDDESAITDNPSIRNLWSLAVLSPPNDVLSVGRPFLNLTFALNYALGGVSVRGYHVVNLLIHILAGITLFGIVRTTLAQPRFREKYGSVALLMALAVATLWTLHPIHTESVTYITQRAESLMGLFYLLTLYFFIRSAVSPVPGFWTALSVITCALGMMTKEVMVSAPLVVLLYDRTFLAGSFREAWRLRWRTYLGLAATWLVLAGLMANWSLKYQGVGYDGGYTWWTYALSESKVVLGYLKLALWPHPLVLDYGSVRVDRFIEAVPYLVILLLLLSLTLLALRRWPALGFLGAWFFLILAPTSSVVPLVGQPMAEHRLYLPSAAIIAFGVVGLYAWIGRKGILLAFPALAIILGILTAGRNSDYRDELTIWSDTVSKRPGNFRAYNNLGNTLLRIPGRLPDAIANFETALKIKPRVAETHYNLGIAFAKTPGRLPDAIAHYETALKIKSNYEEAHYNLGIAFAKTPGRLPDAIAHYEAALRINPDDAEAHNNLGNAFADLSGRLPDAIAHYEAALKIKPDFDDAHNNLAFALAKMPGRLPDAIAHYEAALRFNPDNARAHNNLGNALAEVPGRLPDAIAHYEAALKTEPDIADVHNNLGIAFAKTPGRLADAIAQFEDALKIKPDYAEAYFNLGSALLDAGGRDQEAWIQFEAALRLRPDWEPQIARLRSPQP